MKIMETRVYYKELGKLKHCYQTSLLRWCVGWLKCFGGVEKK
jgi:hypothetical protein